jgi:uncharacterized protein (TIGR00255 family)
MARSTLICSMTGYATAARELAWGSVSIELRSVNHRYLDVSFRMPDELRVAETALREAIAATVTRGKVECRVAYALRGGAQKSAELDSTLFEQLLGLNSKVRSALPDARTLGVADILRWPGMLGTDELPVEDLRATANELMPEVLREFTAARVREGEKLATVILERAADMRPHCGGAATDAGDHCRIPGQAQCPSAGSAGIRRR